MSQYQKEPVEPDSVVEPGSIPQEVPKATYEAMFRHQHGTAQTPQPQVDSGLVSAATLVLDKKAEESNTSKAYQALPDLESSVTTEAIPTHLTVEEVPTPSVPLPSNEDAHTAPVDDLEF